MGWGMRRMKPCPEAAQVIGLLPQRCGGHAEARCWRRSALEKPLGRGEEDQCVEQRLAARRRAQRRAVDRRRDVAVGGLELFGDRASGVKPDA